MCSSQLRKWLQNWWKTFFHFCGGKDLNKKWIYNVNSKSCLPPKNCWWNFKFICVMNVNCSKKIFERATQFSKQGLDRGMENGRWLSGGLIWKKLSFQSRLKWKFFSYQPTTHYWPNAFAKFSAISQYEFFWSGWGGKHL